MKDCVECEKQDRAAKLRAARLPCQENKQETRTFMSVYTIAKGKTLSTHMLNYSCYSICEEFYEWMMGNLPS